ncbi:YibE/F family protein [Yinghuangia sp. ASG 101]|uniref:YibE/F family protein n=1 Tax=Yinghuangia sp. ASG 101 TaxID=2896848 RepID=UPI001E321158|nr:YibE/F family protein [Yinghuangia sp. ASG 101]UGQ13664.1 YibE/F family protein [Yinghuangia sp. ASG 101]
MPDEQARIPAPAHPHDSPSAAASDHAPGHGHGHGHSHAHGPAVPASARVRRLLAYVLVPFALAVAVGMLVMWPDGDKHASPGNQGNLHVSYGEVVETAAVSCDPAVSGVDGSGAVGGSGAVDSSGPVGAEGAPAVPPDSAADRDCTSVAVDVTKGRGSGTTIRQLVGEGAGLPGLRVGDKVVLDYAPDAPPEAQWSIVDYQRDRPMLWLAAIFAVAVVAIGRLRGLMALVGLAVSFAVLVWFVLPAILEGSSPLPVAVVGASAIMLVTLYLCHGFSARTSIAVLGTLVSLALIGVLGELFLGMTKLTGMASDEASMVRALHSEVDVRGLLLAGIVIGSLGVLDDVTVTQTSAVWELKHANPALRARDLYRAGLRIGRDHIASTVNTLVLAYAGASLPLLLLFSASDQPFGGVVTTEIVAEEVVRTLVGSIGLVASVPVTTALAAAVAARENVAKPGDHPGGGRRGGSRRGGRRRRQAAPV